MNPKGKAPAPDNPPCSSPPPTTGFSPFEFGSEAFSSAFDDTFDIIDDTHLMEFEALSTAVNQPPQPPPPPPPPPPPTTTTSITRLENLGGVEPMPRPLESLQGNPVPPFLSKTFDLVDDPSLDPIISWGSTGASFVVWDPMEFSRLVLPRNFKHNNYSSFVRQLNTYGFRKIDADKWEFFNEAFQRGKRHLLRNIQRRRSSQSQQVGSYIDGPSTDAGKSGLLEVEIEKLKKERGILMQEVVDLQQKQRRTVHHAGEVNQRLQSAEQRQKQMVSFLAKLFQNPAFLARLRHKKEQRETGSPRVRRKFVKQLHHEAGTSETLREGKIVRYQPEWGNITVSSELNPVSNEQSPHYLSQDLAGGMSVGAENLTSQMENVVLDKLGVVHEAMPTPGIIGEGSSSFGLEDPLSSKGKNVFSPNQDVLPECFVSFPEELSKEKGFPVFSPLGTESIIKQEGIWEPDFNVSGAASSCGNELWGNPINYEVPEFGGISGVSDIWDFVSGSFGIDEWPADEPPLDEEEEGQAGQPKDDRP